ncbi:MAG: PAS domain S-box protein [Planctomycetia bacterium]|nr:PAS domain S-box protein [Planctomycetia bacterium]
MNSVRDNSMLAAAAVVLSGALCAAWLVDLALPLSGPLARGAALAIPALVLGAAVAALWRPFVQRQRVAQKHLDALCRASEEELCMDPDGLAPSSLGGPWQPIVQKLRDKLADQARRLADYEASFALMELRAKRGTLAQERLAAVLEGLPEPVLVTDEFGELLVSNPPADAVLGLTQRSPGDRAIASIIKCQQLLDLLNETQRRKGSATRSGEITLPDAEGHERCYRVSAAPLAASRAAGAEPSGPLGVVAVFRDVSAMKAAERRHAEFVSAVSHEMKTPLAGIKAYTEMLAEGEAEDEKTREEFLNVIQSQADRLQRLVDNLLNLARVESGVVKVNKQNLSLNALLEEAVNIVRPTAEEKGIDLSVELSPLYLSAYVDRDQMMQTAINLLSNAIKYTPQGGKVTIRSRNLEKQVQFDVEDTGVGLSPEDCQRVFDRFYRVQSTQEMASGTGLGLTLAKSIVEDVHGGCISVMSEVGKGSTFIVTLPSSVSA